MNTKTIALILVLIAVGGGAYLLLTHPVNTPTPTINPMVQSTGSTPPTTAATTSTEMKPAAMRAPMPANDEEKQAPVPGAKPTPTVVVSPSTVSIDNYTFVPGNRTVKKGTTITWTNHDIAPHTITGDTGGPASGLIPQGGHYSYTFTSAGTFPYHCEPHPYMKGTITVTE